HQQARHHAQPRNAGWATIAATTHSYGRRADRKSGTGLSRISRPRLRGLEAAQFAADRMLDFALWADRAVARLPILGPAAPGGRRIHGPVRIQRGGCAWSAPACAYGRSGLVGW